MPHPPLHERPAAAPVPIAAGSLQLEAALQLLTRAGHVPSAPAGSPEWLQQIVDALCTLSSRDPLTGLVNRRQFESALDREIDRVARAGESALLLILDIDFFKRVNDTHGHAVGDVVIQTIGRVLQDNVRPMDTVARIGGEEFAMVLPNCMPAFGHTVAERVRKRIEATRVSLPGQPALCVTISIGGAFAPQWVRSSRLLWLERADRQLYRAKIEGRNRACLEVPTQPDVSAEERSLLLASPLALAEDAQPSTTSAT
jgi:diguanylate cyclase (GGDEF)-like protein